MRSYLKGELIKQGKDPTKAIMAALDCSEKTARNKLNGVTDFTVSEAVGIRDAHFARKKKTDILIDIADLFKNTEQDTTEIKQEKAV